MTNDDADYHVRLMFKLAHRLAMEDRGEEAQFLRDCIDDARRFRFLLAADPTAATIYLAARGRRQSMRPQDVRARIDAEVNEAQGRRIANSLAAPGASGKV